MEPEVEEPIFEIETLQDWQLAAGAIVEEPVEGGGGSNNCSNT